MFHPRVILCPTDFSENSAAALRIGRDLARQNQAALVVLHVADSLGPEGLGFVDVATRLQPEGRVEDLRRTLHQVGQPEPGLDMRWLLREGNPAAVIEQVVREQHCDLVVLGTHGRTGLDHLLMGSIAERIIRRCPCPVLIVKYPSAG
ncbi:MAG TPA: universal stress protein [Gemmataceae bacterium]|nr:universal stress protein [Gemmataceae bacterium]